MKSKNKILSILLAVTMFICMTGFTANAASKASSITFTKTSDAKVRVGYAITRAAVTVPEGLKVTYTSSDTAVATVTETGKVVGKKLGSAVITASAGGLKTSYNVTVVKVDNVTVSTKVFDGFNVKILDKTTPAVSVKGRATDRNIMCFVSASGKEVGTISYSDYNAIIKQNSKIVNLSSGGSYGAPPVEGKSWEDWFADEFNKYRGLNAESRQEAVTTNKSETIEQYRQELVKLVNEEREKAGVSVLYIDDDAMIYAQTRAKEISVSFSHTRPNGASWSDEWYDEFGTGINENIATHITPKDVMKSWMNSPGHRANILNEDAYAIGVGCHSTGTSFYWVQEFLW